MFLINKVITLDEFSPNGTVFLLNDKSPHNLGQLNVFPAFFIYQETSFDRHSEEVSFKNTCKSLMA